MSTAAKMAVATFPAGGNTRDIYDTPDDARRRARIAAAWKAYDGDFKPPLSVRPGETDDNVVTNRCAPIVDTGLQYLVGQSVTIEVEHDAEPDLAGNEPPSEVGNQGDAGDASDGDPAQPGNLPALPKPKPKPAPSPEQLCLDGCWGDDDKKMGMLTELAQFGAIGGHMFLKLIPPDKENGFKYADFVVLDPATLRVQTDPHNKRQVVSYCIQYEVPTIDAVSGDYVGTMETFRQVIRRMKPDGTPYLTGTPPKGCTWQIQNYRRTARSSQFVPDGAAQLWPWPWPPIVDKQYLPNARDYYGAPELTKSLIKLNDTLNLVQSLVGRMVKFYGEPVRWTDGEASVLDLSSGRVLQLSPGSKLEELVGKGDIAGARTVAEDMRTAMDEESHTPGTAIGRMETARRGAVSGIAMRLDLAPLIGKTTFKQRHLGPLIREASTRALALCGFGDGSDEDGVTVSLAWQNPLPSDDLAEAQTWLAKLQMGYSKHTAIKSMGGNPDEEAEYKQAEGAASVLQMMRGQMPPAPQMLPMQPNAQGNPPRQPGESVPGSAPVPGRQ